MSHPLRVWHYSIKLHIILYTFVAYISSSRSTQDHTRTPHLTTRPGDVRILNEKTKAWPKKIGTRRPRGMTASARRAWRPTRSGGCARASVLRFAALCVVRCAAWSLSLLCSSTMIMSKRQTYMHVGLNMHDAWPCLPLPPHSSTGRPRARRAVRRRPQVRPSGCCFCLCHANDCTHIMAVSMH